MEYLFAIWAVVWMVCQLTPPPQGNFGLLKLVALLVGIILIVFVLFGGPELHRM